jgi:FkbM family methyltransferase
MGTKFHRIWFGSDPIPGDYEDYWRAWQRQHPDCEFITWTDRDTDILTLSKPALDRFSSHVARADLARYEILFRFGGIYVDCDIMPYRHFSPSDLSSQLTVCNETESTDYCSIGFIGAPEGHPLFRELIDHIVESEVDEARPNVTTGPWLFGERLKTHPHRRLPTSAFYPYLYDEPFSSIRKKDLDDTLGIHVWGGAWLAPDQKKSKAADLLAKGDIVDSSSILARLDGESGNDLKCVIEVLLEVRTKAAEVALFLGNDLSVDPAARPVFEFGKVVHWLLEQDRDRMVWQIGAADGILVDPLRPFLVNFDPPAMLLEPNPYLYRMLAQAYRNNRNATLLQLAYSASEDALVLNAINPDKAAALNLPRWVLGLSSVYDDKNAIGGLTIDADTTARIQSCIERVTVEVTGFSGLLERSGGRQPDILVIDAEGMDKPIIDDILAHQCRPAVIHFEIQCMDQEESRKLIADLSEDYVLFEFGNDITAYRADMFMDYAKWVYIHNGIPTIFSSGLIAMNGLAN